MGLNNIHDENLRDIILRRIENSISPQEEEIFQQWFADPANKEAYERLAENDKRFEMYLEMERSHRKVHDQLFARFRNEMVAVRKGQRRFWRTLPGWAAAIVVVGSVTIYYLSRPNKDTKNDTPAVARIEPGSDRATLTLASGQTIALSCSDSGHLADQGKASIQQQGGALAYDDILPTDEVVYNELATPRGGNFTVTLSDGSKLMLNSASRVRFPTSFVGKERRVELIEGEVYLDVAKNLQMPFILQVADKSGGESREEGMEIKVLGTRFNVRNYFTSETNIRTTLIEGSVLLTTKGQSLTLAPLQQAVATRGTRQELVLHDQIKADTVIDWASGRFTFDNDNIQTVMRKVSAWYDIDVEFIDDPAIDAGRRRTGATGSFPRTMKLETILKILGDTGVKFEVEGRVIRVYI